MTVESLRLYLLSLSDASDAGRGLHLGAADAHALATGLAPFGQMSVDALVKLIKSASTAATKHVKELEKAEKRRKDLEAKQLAREDATRRKRDAAAATKRAKGEQKQAAKAAAEEQASRAVQQTAHELKAVLSRINHELIEADELDAVLVKLKPFNPAQLMSVAAAIGYDDVPYDGATKAKILKSLTDRIKRVWRTSHRVRQ